MPAHKDLAVRQGSLSVDGVPFLLEPWREDAHAVRLKWMLHSGIPSEDDEPDERPYPRTEPGVWTVRVEDGRPAIAPAPTMRPQPHMASTGCRATATTQDTSDAPGRTPSSAWDGQMLLPPGQGKAAQPDHDLPPSARRLHDCEGTSSGVSLLAPPRQLAKRTTPSPGADPVAEFFEGAQDTLPPPSPRADAQAPVIDQMIAAKLAKPLAFDADEGGDIKVTQKVTEMQLQGDAADAVSPLFAPLPQAVIGRQPTRDKTPLKTRVVPKPTRQSLRQASNPSPVPVSQRATLRPMHGLGILGPKEKMTAQAAEALIRRFDEPLTDSDIAAIAKLTRLDPRALKAIAGVNDHLSSSTTTNMVLE
ncbi:hypothetical protein TRIUR3_28440 [Triticum urartu]|uniref:Uncharacterized protein n=1 Tax=Triticum urartu TaxID=4572 RepID=M7ZQC8_TRIUA|nr:hypothetical protein TRIUR3_28440 [Triticum urartu]